MRVPLATLIEPIRTEDLIVGESYDTWICESCLMVIALDPRSQDANPNDMPDALIRIACPQCGMLKDYSVHARRVRKYPWVLAPA